MRTSYEIDARERIVAVGGQWDVLALESNCTDVLGDAVIGRHLYEFISDAATSTFLGRLFFACRIAARPVSLPGAFDTPLMRVITRMDMAPRPEGRLRVTHTCVERRPLHTAALFRLPDGVASLCCSICNRFEHEGTWHRAHVPAYRARPTYCVCPACRDRATRTLTAFASASVWAAASGSGPERRAI